MPRIMEDHGVRDLLIEPNIKLINRVAADVKSDCDLAPRP
jgi:hypothetical protein